MLVLSRKVNEKIVIDGDIAVTVVKIEGGQVRLGIEAPDNIKVFREEIAGKASTVHRPVYRWWRQESKGPAGRAINSHVRVGRAPLNLFLIMADPSAVCRELRPEPPSQPDRLRPACRPQSTWW